MSGLFDFRDQSVKPLFSAGGTPAFARRLDAVLALLAHLFFFIIRSRLLRIHDPCVEQIMTLVAASKKLVNFDTKTFLSTINGGRKIEAFAKKQTIFAQGDSSDAVFYIKLRKGKAHCRIGDRQGSHNRHSERGRFLRRRLPCRPTSSPLFRDRNDRLLRDENTEEVHE